MRTATGAAGGFGAAVLATCAMPPTWSTWPWVAKIATSFRPGHADYTYLRKYGIRDPRGGGRSSARLTAPAVAAGAIAKKWLREKYGVEVRGYLTV